MLPRHHANHLPAPAFAPSTQASAVAPAPSTIRWLRSQSVYGGRNFVHCATRHPSSNCRARSNIRGKTDFPPHPSTKDAPAQSSGRACIPGGHQRRGHVHLGCEDFSGRLKLTDRLTDSHPNHHHPRNDDRIGVRQVSRISSPMVPLPAITFRSSKA